MTDLLRRLRCPSGLSLHLKGCAPESDLDLAIDITLAIDAGYGSADERGKDVEIPRIA